MDARKWLRLSLINLLIVSLAGTVLRYKIAYSLPFIDQGHLLHGHSHFAFAGWVSQALMALIVYRLSGLSIIRFARYNWILWLNLLGAYGMLISFPIEGYAGVSIFFSSVVIFTSYVFMIYLWKDTRGMNNTHAVVPWFRAAAAFNSFSSLGAFALAYLISHHIANPRLQLGSLYFYLHFQYNGWFTFVILGLLVEKLKLAGVRSSVLTRSFVLFTVSCILAFLLSTLWLRMPLSVYMLVILAASMQLVAWCMILWQVLRLQHFLKQELRSLPFTLFCLSFVAVSIKFILQLGSTVPHLGDFAFGFRPIIIGYMHLVFLGFVSLFIIGYLVHIGVIRDSPKNRKGIYTLISGIILNELALMIQGFAAMGYVVIPYINESLFIISFAMFTALAVVAWPDRLEFQKSPV